MQSNIKFYFASLALTLTLAALLIAEMLWLGPMGLAGVAVFITLEYVKIWAIRNFVAGRLHQEPPALGLFAGMAVGLVVMLWICSALFMMGALAEKMVIAMTMLLLIELAGLALPGRLARRDPVPFHLLYAAAGK